MMRKFFICIYCTVVSCSFFFCNNSDNDCRIITEVNMEEMANMNLPDFHLVRESDKDSMRIEYVYNTEDESSLLFITVGIYQSESDAQNIAENFIYSTSAVWNEGPHMGVSIGDKFWWRTEMDATILTGVVFTRKNSFFHMNTIYYENLKTLAVKIDNDILNKASYIKCIN